MSVNFVNLFSTSTFFVLFEIQNFSLFVYLKFLVYQQNMFFVQNQQYLFGLLNLLISVSALKLSNVNFSNFLLVIFIMIMISNFLYNDINFCVLVSFLTKSLVSVALILLTVLTDSLYSFFLIT